MPTHLAIPIQNQRDPNLAQFVVMVDPDTGLVTNKIHAIAGVISSNGKFIPVDSLDQSFLYNESGLVSSIVVSFNGFEYRKSINYSGGSISSISKWVEQ